MRIQVNGDWQEAADGASLAGLLESMGLAGRRVAVVVNDEVVGADRRSETVLAEADRVEILTFAGGG